MELKFNSDTKHRKQWFTGVSFSHPAKMVLPLQIWIIENYTKPGEVIVDPMAGSGTLMVGCSMGRDVIVVDLEQKFVDMMISNWEKIKQRGPQLGYSMGKCQIIQGDARNLEGILADKVVFSPPYADTPVSLKNRTDKSATWIRQQTGQKHIEYGQSSNQIGNLSYGEIDKIITSPPYEKSLERWGGIDPKEVEKRLPQGYTDENPDNIGNLKSDTYLEAMLQVYQQCFSVLKSGGLMILVTKNFIRNKQIVRLDEDTIKLCEQAGFTFIERHYRKLQAQSFWRVIYQKKYPGVEQIDKEDVLVFGK